MKTTSNAIVFLKILYRFHGCSQIGDPTASFASFLWVQDTKTILLVPDIYSSTTELTRNKATFGCGSLSQATYFSYLQFTSHLRSLRPNPHCSFLFSMYRGPKPALKKQRVWGNLHSLVSWLPLLSWNSAPENQEGLFAEIALGSQAMYGQSACSVCSLLPALLVWVLHGWKTTLTDGDDRSSSFHSRFSQGRFSNVTVMI